MSSHDQREGNLLMNFKFGCSDNVLPVLYFKPANISHDFTFVFRICPPCMTGGVMYGTSDRIQIQNLF